MIRGIPLLFTTFVLGACSMKQGEDMSKKSIQAESTTANPHEILSFAKEKILSLGLYKLIDCPVAAGEPIESTERLCFAGTGEAELFIDAFTPDVAKMGSGKVYWNRDSGLWLSEFDLKNSSSSMVVKVKMKSDSRLLSEDPSFKNYDVFIECILFLKRGRSY